MGLALSKPSEICVVLPFWHGDKHRAARMLSWLLQLGFTRETYGRHVHAVLAHNKRSNLDGIGGLAKLAFASVEEFVPADENEQGWPVACNFLFIRAVEFLGPRRCPFLWLEADAVPLRADFLQKIAAEYAALPRGSFLGCVSTVPQRLLPPGKSGRFLHGGVAVYPSGADFLLHLVVDGLPWDCQLMPEIQKQVHSSALFCDVKVCPDFRTFRDLQLHLPSSACVFHHAKSGALIELLSRRLMGCIDSVRDTLDRQPRVSLWELTEREARARSPVRR